MAERHQERILIVEDEEWLARLLQQKLEGVGYEVQTVALGSDALQQVSMRPPDLVILDVRLPDMDGYTVCRKLREDPLHATLPILMLTALAKPVEQLRGFAHGADAYLTKPVALEDLLKTITALLEHNTSA